MDLSVTLPGGQVIPGTSPIVVIGPNGSGKTRQTRNLVAVAGAPVEFVNALRNTRVAPELPTMGFDTARNNFASNKQQAKNQHWELTNEFDFMLSQLLAQKSMAAIRFMRGYEEDPSNPPIPEVTPLSQVERLWSTVFQGRELHWEDWKPLIKNRSQGAEVTYSGNQMSDGEKAALFVAGRVFTTEPGILVVDEPETHFHSLLAVRLWDALEDARPDLRFIYVTHDLTFAMSRRKAHFVLANPTAGLRALELDERLPPDIATELLGSASLSFYATRVAFCEGEQNGLDHRLYGAWFRGPDTVVRPVGSCQRVLRCVDAVHEGDIAMSLETIGIIDRDYHADNFLNAMTHGVHALPFHEVESLLCLEEIVGAVCAHLTRDFDLQTYLDELKNTISDKQAAIVAVQRWKERMEGLFPAILADVTGRTMSIAALAAEVPTALGYDSWPFDPAEVLLGEERTVNEALATAQTLLKIFPGKQMLPVAARLAGLATDSYVTLVVNSLREPTEATSTLAATVEAALAPHLPTRFAAIPVAETSLT